jgi:3D (Asp-Asp-Asp) domain-containing protein
MVAAPPNIPFGARVVIPGLGTFQVTDRGGAIEGNHFDVFLPWPGFRRLKDWYRGVYWTE